MLEGFQAVASSAAVALVTLLAVLLVPAGLGALRAWATGRWLAAAVSFKVKKHL